MYSQKSRSSRSTFLFVFGVRNQQRLILMIDLSHCVKAFFRFKQWITVRSRISIKRYVDCSGDSLRFLGFIPDEITSFP